MQYTQHAHSTDIVPINQMAFFWHLGFFLNHQPQTSGSQKKKLQDAKSGTNKCIITKYQEDNKGVDCSTQSTWYIYTSRSTFPLVVHEYTKALVVVEWRSAWAQQANPLLITPNTSIYKLVRNKSEGRSSTVQNHRRSTCKVLAA